MKIALSCKQLSLHDTERDTVTRRLQFALSRFAPDIREVRVHAFDQNGPKGGVDKSCRVTVHLHGGDVVTVTDDDADFLVAASRAADRVGRAVARLIDRTAKPRNGVSMSGLNGN